MNSLTLFQNINSHIISILNRVLSIELAHASQMGSVAGRTVGLKQPSAKQNNRISHHHPNAVRGATVVAASACAVNRAASICVLDVCWGISRLHFQVVFEQAVACKFYQTID
jgi:hypothetical protein